MNNYDNILKGINLDSEEGISKLFKVIKKEYLKNLFRVFFLLVIIFLIYFSYSILAYPLLSAHIRLFFDQLVVWFLFISYLIIHFFQLTSEKFSPTFLYFLNRQVNTLNFRVQRKFKLGFRFFLFNGLNIMIFILILAGINYTQNEVIGFLILRLIITYFFLSISIPIIRGVFHDNYIVKLKTPFFVQINLRFKLINHIEAESQMIQINISSNKLGIKSDKNNYEIYRDISEKRWLPRKDKHIISVLRFSTYLRFYEYSTLINFKEKLLNIVSAIREWDLKKVKNFK